ncbi:MAG: RNB domain-containing ribonuclease [Clostridia bacterium]
MADVAHYVSEGGGLDRRPQNADERVSYRLCRSMLPKALSNNICSLNPHEDTGSFSRYEITGRRGQIMKYTRVINSSERLVYTMFPISENKDEDL